MFLLPDISEEDEYMITIECYDFFSFDCFPTEVTIDVPTLTDILSWDREELHDDSFISREYPIFV
jgi:hypothetical protein